MSHRITMTALLLALTALTSCGGDDSGTEVAEAPVCSEQWVEGNTLPDDYSGCQESEGSGKIAATGHQCEDGTTLISHEESFWAFTGGEVQAGSNTDDAYLAAQAECLGEG